MPTFQRVAALALSLALTLQPAAQGSAYDAHPKVVVILVIDQFRADYLERYRADFKGRGFRLFLDRGAYFPDCYYGYANTKTAPGHATIGTGAYTDGHGISSNEWWDLARNKQRPVSSVEDERYGIVGLPVPGSTTADAAAAPTQPATQAQATSQQQAASPSEKQAATPSEAAAPAQPAAGALPAVPPGPVPPGPASSAGTTAPATPAKPAPGSSPRNLLASTVGDELRLATNGASEVWGVSLKDRAAILPSGSAANGAFWIDATTGRFVTSTYYMQQLPAWASAFNDGPSVSAAAQAAAATSTAEASSQQVASATASFYNQVGRTPAANAYELAFAEALITGEQLGKHPTTDLVTISLSPTDILGHQVGPDSPEEHAMVDALDTDLDAFFTWLDKNVEGGLGNVWIALTADHGIAATPAVSSALGLKGAYIDVKQLTANLNQAMNEKFSPGENQPYLLSQQELPYLALNEPVFARAGINEQEAEQAVLTAVDSAVAVLAKPAEGSTPSVTRLPPTPKVYRTYTRLQMAAGDLPRTQFGDLLGHSYSPNGGWYVMVMPIAYQMEGYGNNTGTTHYSPFSYDRHVPLGFYGAPFAPGIYHGRVQPVDLAATFASLLGVNQPSASVGQVLTQALRPSAAVVYPKDAVPIVKGKTRPRRRGHPAVDEEATPDAPADKPSAVVPVAPAANPPAASAPAAGSPPVAPPPIAKPPAPAQPGNHPQ